ncbi:MAG: acetylornithine deacetylase [Alphaproteobacteria bacterium]|nr:MAG: acetylornithine deacetylase [Alphaproteobacteria bacterium]
MTLRSRDMIERLISFDTTSRLSNLALVEFVEDYLRGYGIAPKRIYNDDKTKANLLATIGPDVEGGVVLSGHTDVVPVDDQDWTSDPFIVDEREDKLFGRGTADMKSFVAIALAHVPDMVAADLKRPIHLAFSYDEEVGCIGVGSMIAHMSAHLPRPRAVIVGEPTSMRVINAHKGIRSFMTEVTGLEAHSSQQQLGVNAIVIATKLITFLSDIFEEMKERGDPSGRFEPPHTTVQIGTIHGGTAINIIPHHCSFGWEYRSLPSQDADEIYHRFLDYAGELEAHMQKMSPQCRIVTRQRALAPGLKVDEGSEAETLALALAEQNETHAVSYGTEAGLFQQAEMPTVICGPGDIAQAHRPDEFIELSQVAACERFVQRLIEVLGR